MKKILAAVFCSAAVLLFNSCSSNKSFEIFVPNESKIRIKNISTEYFSIANAYFELKNYEKAIVYYKLAMNDKSLQTAAYFNLGKSYAFAKNWTEAEKIYLTLFNRDPNNLTIKISLAYIEAMNGQIKKALKSYKELVLDNPDNSEVLENYLSLLISTGDLEEAEIQFLVLKNKFPDNKKIETFQKTIYEKLDNGESNEIPVDETEDVDSDENTAVVDEFVE